MRRTALIVHQHRQSVALLLAVAAGVVAGLLVCGELPVSRIGAAATMLVGGGVVVLDAARLIVSGR